jgi:hypothetical protein
VVVCPFIVGVGISHEGDKINHHIGEHLDSFQYNYILKHVIVPSVGVTFLQEIEMLFGPLCQTLGMKLLHLNIMFIL